MSNVEIVAAHYDAAARGDLPAMLADFDAAITWVEAAGFPLAGTYTGPDEVRDLVFAAINAEWKGFGMHVDEFVDQGSTVIALGRYRGTHRRTGRVLDARTAHIWRIEAGKLVGFEQITDTLLVDRAGGDGAQDAEEAA